MSRLKDAAMQSAERWIEDLPDELPEVQFSASHDEKMQKIIKIASKKKMSERNMKGTLRIALVAAVVMVFTLISVSGVSDKHSYTIKNLYGQLFYVVEASYGSEVAEPLNVDYIPEEFVLTEDQCSEQAAVKTFHKEENVHNQNSVDLFRIQKAISSEEFFLGHENNIADIREVKQGRHTYLFVEYVSGTSTVIWNTGEYVYTMYCFCGDLTEDEILKIVTNTK